MRILHTCEVYKPSLGGVQEVISQISKRLVTLGHEVTVATSADPTRTSSDIDGVRVEEFSVRGNAVRGMSGEVSQYRDFVVGGDYDVVMMYAAQQWSVDALLPILTSISARRVIATCGFSGLGRRSYRGYFSSLRDSLKEFDSVVLHSAIYKDARFIEEMGYRRAVVIPNGADEELFQGPKAAGVRGNFRKLLGIDLDTPLLILVGSHTGLKGHAAAMQAFGLADTMRGGVLVVLGNSPSRLGCSQICAVHGPVTNLIYRDRRVVLLDSHRDVVISAFLDADLLLMTSRIECSPIVLFEAAAAGLPFIANDVGNAAEIAAWTGAGEVLAGIRGFRQTKRADVRSFAQEIDRLWRDPERRRKLHVSGQAAFRERFTWEAITLEYERLYQGLLGE